MPAPSNLDAWTLDAIRALIGEGVFEDRIFDFKERLPDSRDRDGQERIVTACAAFANTDGGFLVFGVDDHRAHSVPNRLVGIDRTVQFAEQFDVYPQRCTPAVKFGPIKTLSIDNGRLILVIQVPRDSTPHATGSPQNGFRWPCRTDGGRTEFMGYEEIKKRILTVHGREAAVRELVAELEELADALSKITYLHAPQKNVHTSKEGVEVPAKADLARVSTLLDQGASFAADHETMRAVARLRSAVPPINQAIDDLRAKLSEIGEVGPSPDMARSKASALMQYQERQEEIIEAQGQTVERFKSMVEEHVRQATQAARQAAAAFRRTVR
jgi:hypothetical protein